MRFIVCLFLLFAICKASFAQQFSFKAPLGPVPENNFFKIKLNPEILNQTQPGFTDIRLIDQKNREVAYLLERNPVEQTSKHFREYPIISKAIVQGVNTTLVLQNQSRNKINNIGLLLKNTNVVKKASLSGSSNGQDWFALEENYILQSVSNTQETSEVKVLHFPLSDYEYYRLIINDSASAPLNILAAGYYDFKAEEGAYTALNKLPFTQVDSAEVKKTFLKFDLPGPVYLDKILFELAGSTFYRRNATIFDRKLTQTRKRRPYNEMVFVQDFQLESDSKNAVHLQGFKSNNFVIVIDNADNPPLEFKSINGFQRNTVLIAELRKGKKYELRFGNAEVKSPNYDLAYFKEKIPVGLQVLELGKVEKITAGQPQENRINNYFKSPALIWFALIGVILLLGFMTYQMLKETDKNK